MERETDHMVSTVYTLVQQLPDLHPAFIVPRVLHVCMYLTAEGAAFLYNSQKKGWFRIIPCCSVLFAVLLSLSLSRLNFS